MASPTSKDCIDTLKKIFVDRPDALRVFTKEDLGAKYLKEKFRNNELFPQPIKMYVTGRTGAGKTALGNSLLNDTTVMKSTGFQDCTREIGFFQLGNNIWYFDLPGVVSGIELENINRAVLLLSQLDDEFSDPPVVPLTPSDKLRKLNFTGCKTDRDKPLEELISVADWQSPKNQAEVEPDVIIYVLAPNMQFLREDKRYLGELLKTWKARKKHCIVIPVLNIFEKDGQVLATEQQLKYAREEITKIYQTVHKGEKLPPIVEINSKTGVGIDKVTEVICQILPPDKIGNMQHILREDLKQYAEQERDKRYDGTLSLIAGRLGRYTVDKKLEGQNLLHAAALAITTHGIMTFQGLNQISEIKADIDSFINTQVDQIKKDREKPIIEKKDVMGKKDLTHIVPVKEQVEEEYDEYRPETIQKTVMEKTWVTGSRLVTEKHEAVVPVQKQRSEPEYLSIDLPIFGKINTGIEIGRRKVTYTENEVRTLENEKWVPEPQERENTREVTETEWIKETKTRLVERIVNYTEEVIGTIDFVAAQVEERVGTQHLSGGYPAIEFLLGLGLAVKNYCSINNQADWATSLQQGELQIERKLTPIKSQIEQLVEDPTKESELIELLEKALVS